MVDQDPNLLNLTNQSPEDVEINNLLNEYYDVEFGSSFDILKAAQEERTQQRERKKAFDAYARENGYTPELLYSATEMDITSITGRNAQGLRAAVTDVGTENDKYWALRNAQRNMATGGIRYVSPDGDDVYFNEVGARVGAFGLIDNIRANVKDSQALLGLSFLAPFLSDEVKAKLETIRSDLDNTYGVNPHLAQMRDSALGTIIVWDDVTERAKLKKEEVKSILAEAAPPGGEYTNDWLWSTLSSDPILSEMFSNAGVTKENTLANVDQDSIMPGIKQAMAQKQSRTQAAPDASPQDAKDVKVKLDLLKKSDPNANAATMVAIKKLAAGDNIDPTRQQALQPLISKIAKALNNPGKANILSRALAESLSSSDLSKLDMLAREGMVPKNKVSRFKTAMRTLAKGKDLPISYKDDVIDVVTKLAKIITKPSVMGMVRKGLKEEQQAKEKFQTWVNQGNDFIS